MENDPLRPYGTPIPPRPEQDSLLPRNFRSSPLHPMDKLNPDHAPTPQEAPTVGAPTAPTPPPVTSYAPGPPPTRPWEQPTQTPGKTRSPMQRKFIIMMSLIILMIVVAGGLFLASTFSKKSGNSGAGSSGVAAQNSVSDLAKKGKLTDSTLAKVDKMAYFKTIFQTLATQQKVHLTQENDAMIAANTRSENFLGQDFSDAQIDFLSNHWYVLFNHQKSDLIKTPYFETCYNSNTYLYVPGSANAAWQADPNNDYCDAYKTLGTRAISDGTTVTGLSSNDAKAFADALFAAPKGLISVSNATLAIHDQKQYVKLTAKIKAVNTGTSASPNWLGQGYITTALQKAGVDQASLPMYVDGKVSSGRTITMYIDPLTNLPVYAEYVTDLGIDNKTGKESAISVDNLYRLIRVQYAFGQKPAAADISKTPSNVTLSWPAESR